MLIKLKVKTLDAQTHEFDIDNEITVRELKYSIAERTNIAIDQQRIIYGGRVLPDENKLKEYDIDGKVVHVAERPPPSQLGPSTSSSNSNDGTTRDRSATRAGMRSSPLFRALDGMVVGTMAIPMNARMSNAQLQVNPLTSSFCMNRITVARHMLDCVNNIVAYLEAPERGLNNTSLDILTRGRWTMESTVVEVGITAADLPQNQNIVEMVQGAVSAALRRNGNTNVTVVQLPTVFGSNENEVSDAAQSASDTLESTLSVGEGGTATVLIEDAIDSEEEEGATNTSNVAQAGSLASNSNSNSSSGVGAGGTATPSVVPNSGESVHHSTSTGTNTDDSPAQRRTGTRVLAEVIDQMRTVQTRLSPFLQQFYDLLQNEPIFEEDDNTGRESSQRLYDRVSEALHYMSHAQHAISDIMLDVSQPAPRYLTCRPIMVEQSGYVSSNNYLSTAALAAAAAARHQQHHGTTVTTVGPATPMGIVTSPPPSVPALIVDTSSSSASEGAVEDPVDDPVVVATPIVSPPVNAAHVGTQSNDNHQMQMARLIQAVVNSAPIDTEFHVQINAPSIVSFGMPPSGQSLATGVEPSAGISHSTAVVEVVPSSADTGESNTSSPTNAGTVLMSGGNANQARVNTATLPTTSTQTRSTSRPQLQIGHIPAAGWNGRFIPANMMSSFDRFLSCHSHHIREPEQATAAAATPPSGSRHQHTNIVTGQNILPANRSRARLPPPRTGNLRELRSYYTGMVVDQPNTVYRSNLRTQLYDFLAEHVFEGAPINAGTIHSATDRAVTWFADSLLYLPQYEKVEYDSRASLSNVLRRTMPLFIGLVNETELTVQGFEALKQVCEEFVKLLYSVLVVCVGQPNSEIYWRQLIRLMTTPLRTNFRNESLHFLRDFVNMVVPRSTDAADAEQFIVRRVIVEPQHNARTAMDIDDDDTATGSSDLDRAADEATLVLAPLPQIVVGSEAWHQNVPTDWLTTITQDMQAQSEEPIVQAPYSDAYISGMSAKRKKQIHSSKTASNVRALLGDNVRNAIHNVGATTSTAANHSLTADEIAVAITSDAAIQTSYTEAVRASVRDRVKKDPDYNDEKYPSTSKFVHK